MVCKAYSISKYLRRVLDIFRGERLPLHLHPIVSTMTLRAIPNILSTVAQNSAVMISLIDRFVPLKTSSSGTSVERGITVLTSFVLDELAAESESISILVDSFLGQVSL